MKYERVTAEGSGYSGPIFPTPVYRMACCDCGLVHTMEFSVVQVVKEFEDGTFTVRAAPEKFRVMFRAARNNRATAAMRRERKKRNGNAE